MEGRDEARGVLAHGRLIHHRVAARGLGGQGVAQVVGAELQAPRL